MEDLVIDRSFWQGRRVFLTGHTGLKGAWMALLLKQLGANVEGLALSPDDARNLFVVAGLERDLTFCIADVRDRRLVRESIAKAAPDIVIHMAAQSLVRRSYVEPVETYATNVMGTVHVLEAIRHVSGVRAAVIVTSDKCYENLEDGAGYRENDRFGGQDPYSSSKACAELVVDAYRRSFFRHGDGPGIASVRAGNVIGGGDWSRDRLIPDAMQAFMKNEPVRVRNPRSVRPWQHVLDPVLAYLGLAERLAKFPISFSGGWNFGPGPESEVQVATIVGKLVQLWGENARWETVGGVHAHEAAYLRLNCGKALNELGWRPRLGLDQALSLTVEWYRAFSAGQEMRKVTRDQITSVITGGVRATESPSGRTMSQAAAVRL